MSAMYDKNIFDEVGFALAADYFDGNPECCWVVSDLIDGTYCLAFQGGEPVRIRDWDDSATQALRRGEKIEMYMRWDRKVAAIWLDAGEVVHPEPVRENDGAASAYKGGEPDAEDFVPLMLGCSA